MRPRRACAVVVLVALAAWALAGRGLAGSARAEDDADEAERAREEDVFLYNAAVTLARSNGIEEGHGYLTSPVRAAQGPVTIDVPISPRWKTTISTIEEVFGDSSRWRSLSFEGYSWNVAYGSDASKWTSEGEDIAGITRRLMEVTVKGFSNVEQKSGPVRGRLNAKTAAAREHSVRGTSTSRVPLVTRGFVFRAKSAKKTIHICIEESFDLPVPDPEWDAILASLEVPSDDR